MQNLGMYAVSSVNYALVFFEGLLSFFSPCVISLIPVYMGYLAGGTGKNPDGTIRYDKGKTMLNTLFFVIGISFAFFLLGVSFSAIGLFFDKYRSVITSVGGVIIIIMGVLQLGVIKPTFMQSDKRISINLQNVKVNPIVALVMGFVFSFAWTPCVGPVLSSVLVMASGAGSAFEGNLLVALYCLGFVIPFMLLGVFTSTALSFIKTHKNFIRYTVQIGGIILIFMGFAMLFGWFDTVSVFLNSLGA